MLSVYGMPLSNGVNSSNLSQPYQGNFRDSIYRTSITIHLFYKFLHIHSTTPHTVNSLSGDTFMILYFGLAETCKIRTAG